MRQAVGELGITGRPVTTGRLVTIIELNYFIGDSSFYIINGIEIIDE